MTDLYDDRRTTGSRWTRVNIGEAIPGVPTPLTWSLWRRAMDHAFWWAQEQLGVVGRHDPRPPVTGIALGRPCISVDVTVGQVGRLPGNDPDAFAEQYFGLPRTGSPAVPTHDAGTLRRARDLVRIAGRAPVAFATLTRRSGATAAASEVHWRSAVHGPPSADPIELLAVASRRFRDALAVHTLEGILCQAAYERALALAGDELGPMLVSADGELAEARLATDLWAVAHGEQTEAAFLRDHGFHGPREGELAAASWREDPQPVRAAIAAWADAPADRAPAAAAARRAAARAEAEVELLAAVPRHRRPGARLTLAWARRLVAHRELGKAAFLRHLDVARVAARRLGDDALWCTLDELRADHRPPTDELAHRQARRAELEALDLPLSWVGDPEVLPAAPAPGVRQEDAVAGIGASPGIVSGTARVVSDPAAVQEPIGPDEVLVTRTTDPSWVTLFLTAGALVIDVGGVLSHGAIVARELGIPCVIGTGDGTARITDGAKVTVDGTAGTVTLHGGA